MPALICWKDAAIRSSGASKLRPGRAVRVCVLGQTEQVLAVQDSNHRARDGVALKLTVLKLSGASVRRQSHAREMKSPGKASARTSQKARRRTRTGHSGPQCRVRGGKASTPTNIHLTPPLSSSAPGSGIVTHHSTSTVRYLSPLPLPATRTGLNSVSSYSGTNTGGN